LSASRKRDQYFFHEQGSEIGRFAPNFHQHEIQKKKTGQTDFHRDREAETAAGNFAGSVSQAGN
jgi:hypothetical protein